MDTQPPVFTFRINDACRVLGLGRSTIYKLINEGQLKSITIAGRTLIPRQAIEDLIAKADGNV